jgi:hypothetical protein
MAVSINRRAPLLAGLVFSAAWVVGLAIFSSSTRVRSSGAEVLAGYAGHQGVAAAQFVLTEVVTAVALAVVALSLARVGLRAGADPRLVRAVGVTGILAATIAVIQGVLGVALTTWAVSGGHAGAAGALSETVSRLDGAKMFVLAALALAGGALGVLPRWLRAVGFALAAAIAVSGVGYLFLLDGPATAAWVSLPLLMVWVTGAGIVAATAARPPRRSWTYVRDLPDRGGNESKIGAPGRGE